MSLPESNLLLADFETLLDVEASIECSAYFLERKERGLGIEEVDEHEEYKGETSVEAKSTGGSDSVHEAEEGGRDDEVTAPVGSSRDRSSNHASLCGEELALLPRHIAESGSV